MDNELLEKRISNLEFCLNLITMIFEDNLPKDKKNSLNNIMKKFYHANKKLGSKMDTDFI